MYKLFYVYSYPTKRYNFQEVHNGSRQGTEVLVSQDLHEARSKSAILLCSILRDPGLADGLENLLITGCTNALLGLAREYKALLQGPAK